MLFIKANICIIINVGPNCTTKRNGQERLTYMTMNFFYRLYLERGCKIGDIDSLVFNLSTKFQNHGGKIIIFMTKVFFQPFLGKLFDIS